MLGVVPMQTRLVQEEHRGLLAFLELEQASALLPSILLG